MEQLLLSSPDRIFVNDETEILKYCDVRAVMELLYDRFYVPRYRRPIPFTMVQLINHVERVYRQPSETWSVDFAETFEWVQVSDRIEVTANAFAVLYQAQWIRCIGTRSSRRKRALFIMHRDLATVVRTRMVG